MKNADMPASPSTNGGSVMSRVIKFRGMSAHGKPRFRYGSHFTSCDSSTGHCIIEHSGVGHYEVKPETVGQFTGLKDVNGVEIYEGDRIAALDEVATVSFNDGSFEIGIGKLHTIKITQQYIVDCGFHVIGDIHEK